MKLLKYHHYFFPPKSDMNFISKNIVRLGFCSLKDGATASAIQQWGRFLVICLSENHLR